jgi:hypothetical protein
VKLAPIPQAEIDREVNTNFAEELEEEALSASPQHDSPGVPEQDEGMESLLEDAQAWEASFSPSGPYFLAPVGSGGEA